VPLCQLVLDVAEGHRARPGALGLESTSYQLETLRFPPEAPPTAVAMILNVTPDHIDRYPSMEAYGLTKARAFHGLGRGGLALLSARDPQTPLLAHEVPAAARIAMVDGDAVPRLDGEMLEPVAGETFARELVPLAGRHNLVNALFALAAARHVGVAHEACAIGLRGFEALPHRMKLVGERRGVKFYDDSKATNVASVLAGLDGFERPFVLICGGRAKGDDINLLREPLAARGRGLVAIGESAEQFLAMAKDVVPNVRASDMHEAVRLAASMTGPGEAVLLSPACASWDMYRSFVHRGQVFAEAVMALSD
jgi:UDP-N-acetylmuramoylalanine--D-glutamate ligase